MKTKLITLGLLAFSTALLAQPNTSADADLLGLSGYNNAAFGYQALNAQIGSSCGGNHNTATGLYAMLNNCDGSYNAAHGMNSLRNNSTGYSNAGSGATSLYNNTTGYLNTGCGDESMRENTTGNYNVGCGADALYTNISGSENTALGYAADVGATNLSNATAIGANAIVMNSYHMILGNNKVNVGIGLSADGSGPQNKLEINPEPGCTSGLRFRKLTADCDPISNPGRGVLSVDVNGDVIYVRECCDRSRPANTSGEDVESLKEALKAQDSKMDKQQSQIEAQQQQIDELKALVQSLAGKAPSAATPVSLSDKNSVVLNQNVPNPFAESTVISYNISTDFTSAQMIFSNAEGTVIKTVDIREKGAGSLNVFANDLGQGLYTYKLVVDGRVIDMKKMIRE